ncbi:unnamed protein product [Parajaminaea phylloscopi]
MIWVHYWAFLLPILTTGLWLCDVIGLLVLWSRDGFPQYQENDASFVFISDVGANHKTWFIIFSVLTGIFFIASMVTERYLRSTRRIPGSKKKRQTVYDALCVVFACLGALFLGLLSGLDDVNYSTVHWSCTLLFILCTGISVLFQILELFSLSHHHDSSIRHLKYNAIFKSALLVFAVCVLITFIGLYAKCRGDAPTYNTNTQCDHIVSGAATMEWMCAFILTFFFASITVDLWPRSYYGKQEAMAVKEAEKRGEDPEVAAAQAHRQYNGSDSDSLPQDAYGTVNSTVAPSLHQAPLREASH